jgi:hypothetical protein
MQVISFAGSLAIATLVATAKLGSNELAIQSEHQKGAPVNFILKMHVDEHALARMVITGVMPEPRPISRQNLLVEKAIDRQCFVGVLPRCRDPCTSRLLQSYCSSRFFLPKKFCIIAHFVLCDMISV